MANTGAFLRRVREDFDISIKAVSITAGVHPSFISRIESGEKNVTDEVIDAYASETRCLIVKLLKDKDQDLKAVVQEYVKSRQGEEWRRVVSEMQRLPASLAAIAGVS